MSCQDQCLVMDFDGSTDFYRESTPRARKRYDCIECRGTIRVGDVHQYAAGKTDGDFWVVRTCVVCAEIRNAYKCDSWTFGALWDAIREQMFPKWNEMTAIDCLARLTSPAAIDKMRAEYDHFRGGPSTPEQSKP